MIVPSQDYFRKLFVDYGTPEKIVAHCEAVNRVGISLARLVDPVPNTDLISGLCLVHDAFKHWVLEGVVEDLHEVEVAARIVACQFHDFAQVVRQIGSTRNPIYLNGPFEVKLAHYVDWRVQEDQVIPFQDRLDYLQRAYFQGSPAEWQRRLAAEMTLEEEVFRNCSITPDQLDAL